LILTKTDKASRAELESATASAEALAERSPYALRDVATSSSVYTDRLPRLREEMAELAGL
jgi:hypothetical protein